MGRAPVHRGGHKQEEPGGTDGVRQTRLSGSCLRTIPWAYTEGTRRRGVSGEEKGTAKPRAGEYVAVRVTGCSTGTLFGECLGRTTLTAFHEMHGNAWAEAKETKVTAAAARDAERRAARGTSYNRHTLFFGLRILKHHGSCALRGSSSRSGEFAREGCARSHSLTRLRASRDFRRVPSSLSDHHGALCAVLGSAGPSARRGRRLVSLPASCLAS